MIRRSNNDLNVLQQSPLLNDLLNDIAPPSAFQVNDNTCDHGYYLADGIYPGWFLSVKSYSAPLDKRRKFKKVQENARKDVERAFGRTLYSLIKRSSTTTTTHLQRLSTKVTGGRDEWNDAWETAWLPDDLSAKNRAPWEADVNFSISDTPPKKEEDEEVLDADTKAFVEDMADNWEQRRKKGGTSKSKREQEEERLMKLKEDGKSLYSVENVKRDYRVMKQRVHAGLWVKEIEKMEEAKLGDSAGADDDLDRFLDTASEIFESGSSDLNNSKVKDSWDLKNKPDGWETTSKGEENGNIWEMSQREEDILVQEYERRIAFSKFQIASFIKQHIFSRRRPIDGWKYMIEELGPNARRGSKGSVSRSPGLADPATQPFKEEKIQIDYKHMGKIDK